MNKTKKESLPDKSDEGKKWADKVSDSRIPMYSSDIVYLAEGNTVSPSFYDETDNRYGFFSKVYC